MMLLAATLASVLVVAAAHRYTPDWASLDTRPAPAWYDEAKFGIFLHWGLYSVPGFGSEWFWYYWKQRKVQKYVNFMAKNHPPNFTYADFAPMFRAEFFEPNQWADLFKAAGAKYVVLTSKHHEGFCMWPSKYSWNWNAWDVGPHRDLVGDLAASIRGRTDLHFGLYHSLFEWFNPLYLRDNANNFTTDTFVENKSLPELYEIVHRYKPDYIWSDGCHGPDSYWKSKEFLAWLYNDSPVNSSVVVNDRWGSNGIVCHHGDVWTCKDRFQPDHLIKHKWENAMTVDHQSWGHRREAHLSQMLSSNEIISTLIKTVTFGGNLLLNVGPSSDGKIEMLFEERLREVGNWLKVNGEAIYSTRPWNHQNDTLTGGIWYTSTVKAVYAHVMSTPSEGVLRLGCPAPGVQTNISLLGSGRPLSWRPRAHGGVAITYPSEGCVLKPCVIKMEALINP